MRICFFTPTFLPGIGGTEVVTDALARQLHQAGHHVVVLAHGQPAPLEVPYGVRWYQKPLLHRFYPERIGRHLAALHRTERFDVIVANYGVPTGYAAVQVGRRFGVPVVVVSHGGDIYRSSMRRRHPHLWRRLVSAYREADGLICISPYIEQLVREINPEPRLLEMIPNGIDLAELSLPAQRPADYDESRPFCLCLGNLGPLKGFDDAVEAFGMARERLGSLIMLIVGTGRLEGALRDLVEERQLGDRVRFLGRRMGEDKRWLLQNCRFGLMPSIEEGHPVVGLELLATGRAVICTTNAAFDGMFDDGINALRVPPRTPAMLAEAMVRMQEADLETMGRISRQRAEQYDWPLIAERYLDFLKRVVDRASATNIERRFVSPLTRWPMSAGAGA